MIELGESTMLSWTSTDADSCVIKPGIGSVPVNGSIELSPIETTAYKITATGPWGTATADVTITVTYPEPSVTISTASEVIRLGESTLLTWDSTHAQHAQIDNGIGVVSPNGSIEVSPEQNTIYTISITGPGGSASAQITVRVRGNTDSQPKGSFGAQYEDLIPPGVTIKSYDPGRFSLITGKIQDLAGSPVAGIKVSIHSHPEYGEVFTDSTGRFTIPVEGGYTITVVYQKESLITAHRKVYVPWNDIAETETVQMIEKDPVATAITFDGNPNSVITHQSSQTSDPLGSRSCTMVFTGDNRAYLTDEPGNDIQELATITTRATEFTTPESMPAKLPPNSAYTYCVELSVDGAQRVRFDKPVITWVDNFLGFDVGSAVPVGYYDRDRGVWVPSDNGVVVQLMDTDSDGIVDALDTDGNGRPNDLNNNGSFSDEIKGLGDSERYAPGSTFWRVAVTHFTPWDCNWPFGPPPDAIPPNPEGKPDADQQKDEEKDCKGHISSFVEERSRIFHEDIPIPGTDMTLHYASNRVQGYKTVIDVPASGDTVPASLKKIIVNVDLAGRTFKKVLKSLSNQKAAFVWDGLDYLGRPVRGSAVAHVKVGFVYDAVYLAPRNLEMAFAQAGGDTTGIRARQEVTSWKRDTLHIGARISGIAEGWTLSAHHHVNPMDISVLNKGDGTTNRNNVHIIETVTGDGTYGYSGDDGPADQAKLRYPHSVTVDGSGNLYIADMYNQRIRKVGYSSAFAETMTDGDIPFAEDNGLGHIMSRAGRHKQTINLDTGTVLYEFGYDDDDNLVAITDRFGNRITVDRNTSGLPIAIISPDGITTGLAIDANNHLTRVSYPDNSFYSFEYTPDGLMTAKIEPEANGFEHKFDSSGRLTDATDDEGGHWQFARSVRENGDILYQTLTGEGNQTSYLDHTYSTGAYMSTITDPTGAETLFTQSSDGLTTTKSLSCGMDMIFEYGVDSEYKFKYLKEITESTPSALEKVTLREKTYQDTDADDIPDLITETVTVNGNTTTLSHNIFQSRKTVTSPEGRTVTSLYDPDTLLTTSVTIPGFYDTTYGYDARGRLRTIMANTRVTTFSYDAHGFLESITDPEDHTTTYSYDAIGRMTAINRTDGTTVGFTYDQNGNMTLLTNPSDIDHGFGYNTVNLKSSYRTPLSGSYSYIYDKDRRFIRTNFPSGSQINNVYDMIRLVQIRTPEGNIDLSYLCSTKLGSITNGTDTITYEYDGKLVTSETLTGTLNQSLVYNYNDDFNVRNFTYAGNTEMYTYDNDGLLTGAGAFSITRNTANGLPEAVTGGTLNLTRGFNGYGEMDDQDFSISGTSLISCNLTHDNTGRITAKTETVEGITSDYIYTYDTMGRLLTVTRDGAVVEEYAYDPVGTRIHENNVLRGISQKAFVYSDEDCLLTAGSTSYEYNADGFLTTRTEGTDVTSYDYSSRGELLGVTLPDGRVIDYVHDPLGRRIAKKVNSSVTEKYLWQGMTRLLAVFDGSDNLIMRFEYADARMPVAMTMNGSTYYLTCDQAGSLKIVADAAANVIKRISYDSFGNIIDTNPSFAIPFGFAGGLHDRDTGLVRFGYRDYDPDTGRWTAKDPIGFAGGDTDLYGYCLNDPVNLIDPLGLETLRPAGAKYFFWETKRFY